MESKYIIYYQNWITFENEWTIENHSEKQTSNWDLWSSEI